MNKRIGYTPKNEELEKLEESMASQKTKTSPAKPTRNEISTQSKKKLKKAKTSLPTTAPEDNQADPTEVPITRDHERQVTTHRLAEGMASPHSKRPRTTDCSLEEYSFTLVQRKKNKDPAQHKPKDQHLSKPGKPSRKKRTRCSRIPTLVIEGTLICKLDSPNEPRKVIRISEKI